MTYPIFFNQLNEFFSFFLFQRSSELKTESRFFVFRLPVENGPGPYHFQGEISRNTESIPGPGPGTAAAAHLLLQVDYQTAGRPNQSEGPSDRRKRQQQRTSSSRWIIRPPEVVQKCTTTRTTGIHFPSVKARQTITFIQLHTL